MRTRKQRVGRQKRLYSHRGRLAYQRLEDRRLLAGDIANPLHNYSMPKDVNGDASITAVDVLIVLNSLANDAEGEAASSNTNPNGNRFVDVNNDGLRSAIDALMVVNGISQTGNVAAATVGNGSISGFVFNDLNPRNGERDAGEDPLPGLGVALFDLRGNPSVPVATTTTNSQGVYEFSGRAPGLYRVALQPLGSGQEQTFPLFERFAKSQFIQTAVLAGSVDAADLNDDGFIDLVVGNEMDSPQNHQQGSLTVLTNLGGGETPFSSVAVQSIALPNDFRIQSVQSGDLDNDGDADLLVSSFGVAGQSSGATNGVFAFDNNGSGVFPSSGTPLIVCSASCDGVLDAISVDATGDGRNEVFAVSQRSGTIAIELGSGAGVLLGPDQIPARPLDLASGDLNGDGIADVVTAHFNNHLSILMSGSGLTAPMILDVGTKLSAVEVADLDSDGNQDILAADWGDTLAPSSIAKLNILYGDGRGNFAPVTTITLGASLFPSGLAVEPTDDLPDLLISNESGSLTLLENLGGRRFSNAMNIPISLDPSELSKADSSLASLSNAARLTPMGVEFIDVTGDGVPEAIVANKVGGVAIYQDQFDDYRVRLDGADRVNLDFGVAGGVPPVVRGTQFIDANANGLRELSESGLAGVTIFVDLNGNDRLDAGEPQDLTGSDGTYSLVFPGPGTYTLREIVPPGFVQTAPASGEHVFVFDGVTAIGEFDFGNAAAIDFGDVPDSYGTTLAVNGASHGFVSGLTIGSLVDPEFDGQPSTLANGDDLRGSDDEEGVRLLSPIIPGSTATFEVTVTNATTSNAFLQAFIDFNGDGDLNDPGEQVGSNISVASGSVAATVPLTVPVPAIALLGTTYARFRLSQTSGLAATGSATTGEVEDYSFTIQTADEIALDDEFAVSSTAVSTPLDVLANDSNTIDNPLTIESPLNTTGTTGQVMIATDNQSILYTPVSGFTGRDEFSYTVVDQFANRSTARVIVSVAAPADFGDAPVSYGTLLSNDGPRHLLGSGLVLGSSVDAEADGQPNAFANGDDVGGGPSDETGVSSSATQFQPLTMTPGQTETVFVTASGSGFLDAFIDFNDDGDFLDIGEQIFRSEPLSPGVNTLTVAVPLGANAGETFSRWRISSSAVGLPPTGQADDGEVEDHPVTIETMPPMPPPIPEITGSDPHIVFVIDVSGSATARINGTDVGDVNNDLLENSVLDVEIEAFKALNNRLQMLVNSGVFNSATVSLVTFSQDSTIVNFGSTMTDSSAPGNDVADALASVRFELNAGSSFTNALDSVDSIFDRLAAGGKDSDDLNMFLLSDGKVSDFSVQSVALFNDHPDANLRAFGIGVTVDPRFLRVIDPSAFIFSDPQELISSFGSVVGRVNGPAS